METVGVMVPDVDVLCNCKSTAKAVAAGTAFIC